MPDKRLQLFIKDESLIHAISSQFDLSGLAMLNPILVNILSLTVQRIKNHSLSSKQRAEYILLLKTVHLDQFILDLAAASDTYTFIQNELKRYDDFRALFADTKLKPCYRHFYDFFKVVYDDFCANKILAYELILFIMMQVEESRIDMQSLYAYFTCQRDDLKWFLNLSFSFTQKPPKNYTELFQLAVALLARTTAIGEILFATSPAYFLNQLSALLSTSWVKFYFPMLQLLPALHFNPSFAKAYATFQFNYFLTDERTCAPKARWDRTLSASSIDKEVTIIDGDSGNPASCIFARQLPYVVPPIKYYYRNAAGQSNYDVSATWNCYVNHRICLEQYTLLALGNLLKIPTDNLHYHISARFNPLDSLFAWFRCIGYAFALLPDTVNQQFLASCQHNGIKPILIATDPNMLHAITRESLADCIKQLLATYPHRQERLPVLLILSNPWQTVTPAEQGVLLAAL